MVCGEIGLAPSEFYSLLYSELLLLLEGHRDRARRELRQRQENTAWALSWLLAPYHKEGTEPISMDQILGRKPRRKVRRFATMEESAQAWFEAYNKAKESNNGK